jgi:hypothetical protein
MEQKLTQFMTVYDLLEIIHNPERVPDLQLKREIIGLVYCDIPNDVIWDYINSYNNE